MTRRGLLLFGAMSLIWGIPYFFIAVVVAEVPPAFLVLGRAAIGAAILLPLAAVRADIRPVLARLPWVLAFAAVEMAVPWILLGTAEQHISSSLAGLLIAGVPLVGTLIALVSGDAHGLTRTSAAGLAMGLAGVAAIVGADFGSTDLGALASIAVVVVGYALGPAILVRRLVGLPSIGVMAVSLTITAAAFVPIAALAWPPVMPSPNALGSIAILGVVCTAAAFVLFGALIAEIGPVRATVITYINPAVAAVLGVLVLRETFTAGMAVGFILVIVGSALATRRPGLAPRPIAPGERMDT